MALSPTQLVSIWMIDLQIELLEHDWQAIRVEKTFSDPPPI